MQEQTPIDKSQDEPVEKTPIDPKESFLENEVNRFLKICSLLPDIFDPGAYNVKLEVSNNKSTEIAVEEKGEFGQPPIILLRISLDSEGDFECRISQKFADKEWSKVEAVVKKVEDILKNFNQ